MSDFLIASNVERQSPPIPSAPQPGQHLQRPSRPTTSEPRRPGAPLSAAALKAKRLKALREQGKSKAPFVANTDLIDNAAKPRPCTHCDKPRLRVGPYCSEHKRQKNAEYLARKAQGASAKRAALHTRQKAIAAQEAKAEPAAPAPRAERPTEPMRHEAIMRAIRMALRFVLQQAEDPEARDVAMAIFDAMVGL